MYGRGVGVSISLQARVPPFLGRKLRPSVRAPPSFSCPDTGTHALPSFSCPDMGIHAPRILPQRDNRPLPGRPLASYTVPNGHPCAGPAHRAPGPGPSVILVPRHGNPRPSVPRDATKWLTLAQNVSLWKTIRHAPLVNLSNLRASALRHPGPFRVFRVSRGARRVKPRRYDDKASLRPLRRPADLLPRLCGGGLRRGRGRRTDQASSPGFAGED